MIGLSSIPKLKTVSGVLFNSGENIIVAAIDQKCICVTRYKLRTDSTTIVIVSVLDSSGGTTIDQEIMQAPTNGVFGSNESTPAPSYLFSSLRGEDLVLLLSASITISYSITYYESGLDS